MATTSAPARSTRCFTGWRPPGCSTPGGETVDGRRRRLYAITDRGREVLVDCHVALGELAGELLPS